jgi:hypothetical protein
VPDVERFQAVDVRTVKPGNYIRRSSRQPWVHVVNVIPKGGTIRFYGPGLDEIAVPASDNQIDVKTECVAARDIRPDDFICSPDSHEWLQLLDVQPSASAGTLTFFYEEDSDGRGGEIDSDADAPIWRLVRD